MLLHFQKQFEEWWKKYLKEIDAENNGLRISSKEIKAYCQKAYEQGRLDERSYIWACMRDTESRVWRKDND